MDFEKIFNDLNDETLRAEALVNLKTEIDGKMSEIENLNKTIEKLNSENTALKTTNTALYMQVVKTPASMEEDDDRDDYEKLLDKFNKEDEK